MAMTFKFTMQTGKERDVKEFGSLDVSRRASAASGAKLERN